MECCIFVKGTFPADFRYFIFNFFVIFQSSPFILRDWPPRFSLLNDVLFFRYLVEIVNLPADDWYFANCSFASSFFGVVQ